MPIEHGDRPTPPGHPGPQPIEVVDVNGTRMPVSVFNEVLAVAEKMGLIFRIQPGQGQLTLCAQLCQRIMTVQMQARRSIMRRLTFSLVLAASMALLPAPRASAQETQPRLP